MQGVICSGLDAFQPSFAGWIWFSDISFKEMAFSHPNKANFHTLEVFPPCFHACTH